MPWRMGQKWGMIAIRRADSFCCQRSLRRALDFLVRRHGENAPLRSRIINQMVYRVAAFPFSLARNPFRTKNVLFSNPCLFTRYA